MDNKEFKAFLELMMCSDPWPVEDKDGFTNVKSRRILFAFAHKESQERGFNDWIEALHDTKNVTD